MNKFEVPIFDNERVSSPTRRALEATRLSGLPPIPRPVVCENCGARIETDNEFQFAVKLCRQCLGNYANMAAIIERYTESKIRRNFTGDK